MNKSILGQIGALEFAALNSVNDGIVIVDMNKEDQPVVFTNPAFEQLTGYCAEEILGKNCRFLQGSLTSQPEIAFIRAAIRDQKNCRVVLKNMKKDGTVFWNELSLAPIKQADKKNFFYIGIQKDVTNEIMNNIFLKKAFKKNTKDAMQEAIFNFADQISQPLTAISIFSKACTLLVEQNNNIKENKLYDSLEEIEAQTLLARELIHTVTKSFNESNSPIDKLNLNDLIIQFVDIFKFTCTCSIQLDLDPELPHINIAQEHFIQILLNLLRNSVEAFQCDLRQDGQITISTTKLSNWIELKICDNGHGMSKDFINKDLAPYFTSKSHGIGTGLGICKKLIYRYMGTISFEDNNPGLSVVIHFPY
jgi:PAS domain S-box-containing protein